MSLRLVLLGAPGSGKGTLATMMHAHLSVAHLSTGERFRQEIAKRSTLGRAVDRYVTEGRLVPDELVVRVMTRQLTPRVLQRGFVLDGFPRTVAQAAGLDQFLQRQRQPLQGAIHLACPASVLIARLSGRRVCQRCGAIYHLRNMPPKRAGFCDRCRGRLITRGDDRVATIRKRLAIDRAQATPLVAYYRTQRLLYRLNGSGSSIPVFQRARRLFRREGWCDDPTTSAGLPKADRRTIS